MSIYPNVLGSDCSGSIVSLGPDVTRFSVGDRVMGLSLKVNQEPDYGAWQTYTLLRAVNTTRLPERMGFEEGAVFPMAVATSAIAIFECLGIERPVTTRTRGEEGKGILIWGGASSVGTMAIQLARNLGFTVFATASPIHHDYLKGLGASELFDYRSHTVCEDIVTAASKAGVSISYGFDCVTEGTTAQQSAEILLASGGKGSKLCLVLPWPEKYAKPEGLDISMPAALRVGLDLTELGEWLFNDYLEKALEDGSIVPSPKIEIIEGGIGATQKVFDILRKGVSGKKLVVTVDEGRL